MVATNQTPQKTFAFYQKVQIAFYKKMRTSVIIISSPSTINSHQLLGWQINLLSHY